MVVRRVLFESKDKACIKDASIFDSPDKIKPLVSKLAWKILLTIKSEPLYPLQIAKKIDVHEQKVYYHINRLFKAGLIKISKEAEIKGANAKFYSPAYPIFGVDLGFGEYSCRKSNFSVNSNILDFFKDYNRENFTGLIVIGSPEPHGPLNAWAKDGHYSNYLSFFLGSFINFSKKDFIALDINIKSKKKFDENFILIGGPGVNVITLEFNEYLPVKFDTKFSGEAPSASFGRGLVSSKTGRVYTGETIGVIEKIVNPFDKTKSVIVLAGITKRGTLSAIHALVKHGDEVLKNYEPGKPFARIVEGFDTKGEGTIDKIEIRE